MMEPVHPFRGRDSDDATSVSSDDPAREGGTERKRLTQLLRAVAKGDEDAFATVYDLTAARVHGLVLRVLRNPAQAEEVTQEVYLEVWRRASHFDPGRGVSLRLADDAGPPPCGGPGPQQPVERHP